jgi:ribosomal protein S18 acetylase RimI-like enzyme
MPLTVRPASPADLDALAPLFDAYLEFYQRPADPARTRAFLADRLGAADATVLLAKLDGQIVGFALMYPGWSSLAQAPILLLSDLFVDPAARQQGAGRALLEACEARGREVGASRLQLETQRTNTVAQALYTELGWDSDDEFVVYQLPLEPAQ